ncbi:MAG: response regulator transcription factor [Chloroflexi bacterium]|nr:response regulator transcription factor [Chloroflexota bacterium]
MTSRRRARTQGSERGISILVVDGQVLFRKGIQRLLDQEEDIQVAGETGSSTEAISLIETLSPTVILIGNQLEPDNGIDLAGAIRLHHPEVSIIFVSDAADEEDVVVAMRAGVSARLARAIAGGELASSIRAAYRGEMPIAEELLHRPAVASLVLEDFRRLTQGGGPQHLTAPLAEREARVLALAAQGSSSPEIGQVLSIDGRALHNALQSVLQKLYRNKQVLDTIASRFEGRGGGD